MEEHLIFRAIRRLRSAKLLYKNEWSTVVEEWNSRAHISVADDKLLTKRYAASNQAETPAVLEVMRDMRDIGPSLKRLLSREAPGFALKPGRGSGGNGVVLISDAKGGTFRKLSGESVSEGELSTRCAEIMSGYYSLYGEQDFVFAEELIKPAVFFDRISYKGVPDVRVVVFQGIPIMAMMRLPTRSSDGRSNLHQGAVGVGIDLSTGTTVSATYKGEAAFTHPDTGSPLVGLTTPHWQRLLEISARSHSLTDLGYVGVDIVVDELRGPLLLELNARPGLSVQLANETGLRRRIDMVKRAPEARWMPESDRVAWAQDAFRDVAPSVPERASG